MEIKIQRRFFADRYTIGAMTIDGVRFCDTLEDRYRDLTKEKKVMHETAIPFGTYNVTVSRSPKFKRELPRLLNVPHFEGILIHRGNRPEDSSGCILVGENKIKGQVVNSTPCEAELLRRCKNAIDNGDRISIEITR